MSVSEELEQLENIIANKIPLSPSGWLDIIGRVVVKMGDETDKLWGLDNEVSKLRVSLIEKGESVAMAKEKVRALDIYKQYKKQEALCDRITELVRIGKLQSKLKGEEYLGGNL